MEYWKEMYAGLQTRFKTVTIMKNGVIFVSEFLFTNTSKITVGGTTYLVSSFFKNDGRGNAIEKVSRLIEREAENLSEK